MRSIRTTANVVVAALVWVLVPALAVLAAPASTDKPQQNPTEKARKALEKPVDLEFDNQSLESVLQSLSNDAKVKIAIDSALPGYAELQVTAKLRDVSLRTGLRSILNRYCLTFIVSDGEVLITTEELAVRRQMRQPVNLDLEDVPLATALKQLSRSTGTNLVLDPRAPKEAKAAPVTLQLEDVPLETAVRLMAEVAGLKSARVGNVLFITTEARADKLKSEGDGLLPPSPMATYAPAGGFAPPPVGAPGQAPPAPAPVPMPDRAP